MNEQGLVLAARLYRTIRVGALGMDQRQRDTLSLLFNHKCKSRYVLKEDGTADVYLLDLDVFGGRGLWEKFRERYPRRPLIVFSLSPPENLDLFTAFVKKPIDTKRFIETIEDLLQRFDSAEQTPVEPAPSSNDGFGREKPEQTLQEAKEEQGRAEQPPLITRDPQVQKEERSPQTPREISQAKATTHRAASLIGGGAEQAFVGTSPDIDPQNPEQLAKIYYDPALYLQGHFQQALDYTKQNNKNVAIEGPWPTISIFTDQEIVRVSARERHLRPYCTLPDATRKMRLRPLDDLAAYSDYSETYSCSITAFHWQLALWASRGRLPEGTEITRPVHLRCWPNFTRVAVTPHALAITALWANRACSLIETASILNIPQRYVFAVYSAAHALELIEQRAEAAVALPLQDQPVTKSRRRGTLGRLLGYLKGQKARQTLPPEPRWH